VGFGNEFEQAFLWLFAAGASLFMLTLASAAVAISRRLWPGYLAAAAGAAYVILWEPVLTGRMLIGSAVIVTVLQTAARMGGRDRESGLLNEKTKEFFVGLSLFLLVICGLVIWPILG